MVDEIKLIKTADALRCCPKWTTKALTSRTRGPPMTLSNVAQRGEGLGTTLPPEPDSEVPRRALLFEVNN